MGQNPRNLRDLIVLSRCLKQSAEESILPGYRDKFLKAAAELDARINLLTIVVPDNWPPRAQEERSHRTKDLPI
jgi:hypothetical protein